MYHPALDPYHSAFRMLNLLAYAPGRLYERPALRILDFYAVFPELIPGITLPRHLSKWKRTFSNLHNPYWYGGQRTLVFARMQHLQETALNLLYAQGLVDPEKFTKGYVQVKVDNFRRLDLPKFAAQSGDLLQFLVTELGTLPLHGIGGLKERTHLLEYRYDNV